MGVGGEEGVAIEMPEETSSHLHVDSDRLDHPELLEDAFGHEVEGLVVGGDEVGRELTQQISGHLPPLFHRRRTVARHCEPKQRSPFIDCKKQRLFSTPPPPPGVEVLDLCFDFESRASALLRLKFRGREAILNRAQSRNIPNFG